MNIDLMELEMYALKYQNRFGYDEPFFINLIDLEKLEEDTKEKLKAIKWCVENDKPLFFAPNIKKIAGEDFFKGMWDVF
jgi:hypothetical protein